MKKRILFVAMGLIAIMLVSSCTGHKDCQGRRHKIKTDMGGWM